MLHRTTRYRAKPLASTVAALAIVVGVVVSMLASGLAAEFSGGVYQQDFDHLARAMYVTKSQPRGTKATAVQSLSDADVDALRDNLDSAKTRYVIPIATGRAVLQRDARTFSGSVVGASENYLAYLNTPLLRGRMFTAAEVAGNARVIVLAPGTAKALFPGNPKAALGAEIRVGRLMFEVIGLVGKDATNGSNSAAIAPVSTVRKDLLGGVRSLGQIGIVTRDAAASSAIVTQATQILEQQRGRMKAGRQNDFSVTSMATDRSALARPLIIGGLWFAAGVAGLCLVLGVLATASLRAASGGPPRGGAGALIGGSLRDALVCAAPGLVVGVLGGEYLASTLRGVAPGAGTPHIVTWLSFTTGLGFAVAVGVAGAVAVRLRRRRRPVPGPASTPAPSPDRLTAS